MPDEQYCEPCQKFLCGETQFRYKDTDCVEFDHHPDASSFKAALKLPCYLCSFAWNKRECSLSWQESISCGTIGRLNVRSNNEKWIQFRYRILKYEMCELASHDIFMLPYDGMSSKYTFDFFQSDRNSRRGISPSPEPSFA
jgi:hypothetical protein